MLRNIRVDPDQLIADDKAWESLQWRIEKTISWSNQKQ